MNKLITAVVASAFALCTVSAFAQTPAFKSEPLTAEQKTEIRDRVERLKSERAKADTAKPAEPAKAMPKKTSKVKKTHKQVASVPKIVPKAAPVKTPAKV